MKAHRRVYGMHSSGQASGAYTSIKLDRSVKSSGGASGGGFLGFDLRPSEEQQALKETLHELAEKILRDAARGAETDGRTPDEVLRSIHEIGVTAPVDEDFGGGGTFDSVTYVIGAEELAWGDPGIAFHILQAGLAAIIVGRAGTDDQKRKYLPAFAESEATPTFVAIAEKLAAGDLESLDTTIDADKVSGTKHGVLDPQRARFGIVVGRGDDIGAVIVDGGSYEIVRTEDKLGLEAAPTGVVSFDQAGDAIEPSPELTQAVLLAKLACGAIAVGCARASLEYASQYAIEREAFGKPIGAFQGIAFKIAEMATEVDAARGSVLRAAWKIDQKTATLADVAEANGQAMSAAVRCGDDGVQILGGHGYIRDHPVEKWFRDAVTLSVLDGPDVTGDAMVARSIVSEGIPS
jgi:alkylation response protein AidB-like acyl-CoA dehydrogenase